MGLVKKSSLEKSDFFKFKKKSVTKLPLPLFYGLSKEILSGKKSFFLNLKQKSVTKIPLPGRGLED